MKKNLLSLSIAALTVLALNGVVNAYDKRSENTQDRLIDQQRKAAEADTNPNVKPIKDEATLNQVTPD